MLGNVSRKSYKPGRSLTSLAFRGGLFWFLFLALTLVIGAGVYLVKREYPLAGFLEPVLLTLVLSGGAVWFSLFKLYRALSEGSKLVHGSYFPIAVSTRIDLNSTDDFGITRTGIGYMAVAFDKGLVAPLFWYLIGGLPFAFLYSGLACAAWALSKQGFAKGFGDLALWIEKFFGFFPNFLSGLFLTCASLFTPTARLTRSLAGYFSSTGAAPYAEGGLPVTITARSLKVSLGGPVQDTDGIVMKRTWVGSNDSTARLDKFHLRRAIYLSMMAHVLVLSLLVAGLLAWKLLAV
jgi:adenosylcobinamide-phosphate synthase